MTVLSPNVNESADDSLTKAERTRRTRSLLIETALSCIARYGYAKTSLKLIAEEAGVSRGPLHYHYKDKNELMGAVAEALPQRVSDESLQRLLKATTIEDRMEALVNLGIEQHLGDHHLIACELLIATRHDPELAAVVLPHISSGERKIQAWWSEYARDLNWDENTQVAFRRMFVAALRGLALDHIEFGSDGHAQAAAMLKEMVIAYSTAARRSASNESDQQHKNRDPLTA